MSTHLTYYSLDRSLVVGNGLDEPTTVLDAQYSCHWTIGGARAASIYWAAKGWSVQVEGPHDLPANCDTSKILR
jgi:hypothetical protein